MSKLIHRSGGLGRAQRDKAALSARALSGLGVLVATLALGSAGCAAQATLEGEGTRGIEQASEGEECLVGEHAIEHTCLHATHGPFASVSAAPYPGPVFSAISTPHTAYTVTLPSSGTEYGGQVIYQPSTTGAFAFFLAPDVELTLYPSSGLALTPVGEQAIGTEECAGLNTAVVFSLDENETYTVVYGPAPANSVLTIAEYLGSEATCEECEHIELEASGSRRPYSRENGLVHLEHEVTFEVPGEIAVTEGTSIGSIAVLKFGHEAETSTCLYAGWFDHPETLELVACNHGYEAGSDAEADTFELKVKTVGLSQSVSLELEIHPEACEEGDHE